MKKIFLLLTALVSFATVSNAQIVRSNSSKTVTSTVEKEPTETVKYMRLGLNFMKIGGDDVSDAIKDYMKSNLGYQIIWGFEKPLGPLFWGMEYGLSSRGYKLEFDNEDEKLFVHSGIFSPFNLGYKYGITDELAVEGHVGAYISGDYFGKCKGTDEDGESYEESIYDFDDWSYLDAGMQFGFGLWYNQIGIDFLIQKGFINMAEDVKWHTSNFMIRFGVAF